jgi:uncharacterized protein (DUF433 family)
LPLAADGGKRLRWKEGKKMAILDWSQCPAVESVPGRLSGAWVFRDTRMPVSAVFENLEAGATIDDIIEQFDITREHISAVLEFAARSLDPVPDPAASSRADAHSL